MLRVVKSLGEKRMEAALDKMSLLAAAAEASMIGAGWLDFVAGKMILGATAVLAVTRLVDESGLGRISRGFFPFTVVWAVSTCAAVGVTDWPPLLLTVASRMSRCSESSGTAVVAVGLGANTFDLDLTMRFVLDLDGLRAVEREPGVFVDTFAFEPAAGLGWIQMLDAPTPLVPEPIVDLMGDNDAEPVVGAVITFNSLPFSIIAVVGAAVAACVSRPSNR